MGRMPTSITSRCSSLRTNSSTPVPGHSLRLTYSRAIFYQKFPRDHFGAVFVLVTEEVVLVPIAEHCIMVHVLVPSNRQLDTGAV